MAKLIIEFPMRVLASYNGGLENLDITLDDNITYFLRSAVRGARILKSDEVQPIPGELEKLYRYIVDYVDSSETEAVKAVVEALSADGYLRGCTIRSSDNAILRSDEDTHDVAERRRLKGY